MTSKRFDVATALAAEEAKRTLRLNHFARAFAAEEANSNLALKRMAAAFAAEDVHTVKLAVDAAESFRKLEALTLPDKVTEALAKMNRVGEMFALFEPRLEASFAAMSDKLQAAFAPNIAAKLADIERASKWLGPTDELSRLLERYSKEQSSLDSLRGLAQSFSRATATLSTDLIEVEVEPALQHRAVEAFRTIASEAEAQPTLQGFVDQIVQAVEFTKEPAIKRFMWCFVAPLLLLLLGSVADFYIKKSLDASSKQQTPKAVKEAVREEVGDVRMLGAYRFVRATKLTVRSGPRARSPAMGQLHFGQGVRVLEKKGDFTLIEWKAPDGKAELQGWVFSRYLQRFD